MLSHYFISTLRTQSNVEKNPDIAASLKDEITTLKLKRTNIVYRYFPIIGELLLFSLCFVRAVQLLRKYIFRHYSRRFDDRRCYARYLTSN